MTRRVKAGALAVGACMVFTGLAAASQDSQDAKREIDIAQSVREELAALPYYDVFDLLTYQVSDSGVVTLGGYVLHSSLKDEAEKAIRKITGVKDVVNRIQELQPASSTDEDIRGAAYQAIYRESPLSQYGTDDPFSASRPRYHPWGREFRRWGLFGEPRWAGPPFLGMEPVGNYPIHIIVSNGSLTLVGVVDNQPDKDLVGSKASGVAGASKVTNDVQVESTPKPR